MDGLCGVDVMPESGDSLGGSGAGPAGGQVVMLADARAGG